MDLRFIAVLMAVAVVMDMLGRMAKKRAAERQGLPGEDPPGEDWAMMKAPAEAGELPQPVAWEVPQARLDQVVGGFELRPGPASSPGTPDSVERKPVIDHVERESALEPAGEKPVVRDPVIRDRAPRPLPVRSADSLFAEHRPEPAAPSSEFAAPAPPQLPRAPARQLPAPPTTPRRRFRAAHPEDRLGLGTPGGLRTAMAAREILGPPLALRSDDGGFEGR